MIGRASINVEQGVVGFFVEGEANKGIGVTISIPEVSVFDGIGRNGLPFGRIAASIRGFDKVKAMGKKLAEALPLFGLREMVSSNHWLNMVLLFFHRKS